MTLVLYIKNAEDLDCFGEVIEKIRPDAINAVSESRRTFRELERLMKTADKDTAIVVSDLSSLGLNDAEIADRLGYFVVEQKFLVICGYAATYVYGVSSPMNAAILDTIKTSVLIGNSKVIEMPRSRRHNSGRNRIPYPDNWEELYELWDRKKISSKEFCLRTGLKRATFFNCLASYKEEQERIRQYCMKYSIG